MAVPPGTLSIKTFSIVLVINSQTRRGNGSRLSSALGHEPKENISKFYCPLEMLIPDSPRQMTRNLFNCIN